jgi:phosphatidylglycerophosphate synthase
MKVNKWAEIKKLQKGRHFMSYIHKPFEDFFVYILYNVKFVTADIVSVITYILAFSVIYFFATDKPGTALIIMIIVGVLDGVDGKLARLRKKKTYIGKLEHSFDFLFEQAWWATFILYIFFTTDQVTFLYLGFVFIIIDGFVRHIYNTFWLATGTSLKDLKGGFVKILFRVDGRRSVYVLLHMVVWFLLGNLPYALYTMIVHSGLTALLYSILSFRNLNK